MANEYNDRTTRRVFVKEFAGAAIAGALVGLGTMSAPPLCVGRTLIPPEQNAANSSAKKTAEGKGALLVAPCGLYCGACPMYLATQDRDGVRFKALMKQFSGGNMQLKREDLECDGCIANGRVASFCRKCEIRACADAKPTVTRCSDCFDFPCSRITNFNNDGMLHHAEVLTNLGHIKEIGMKEWTKQEEDRWSCPQCRASVSWYDAACLKCGTKRSDRLFPLKKV